MLKMKNSMKYLVRSTLYRGKVRRFNESLDENELLDFCEANLAYLLDEGFDIMISGNNFSGDSFKSIKITNPRSLDDREDGTVNYFKWNDIKDHFIPFLTRLLNEYSIYGNFVITDGILFHYVAPMYAHDRSTNWYKFSGLRTTKLYRPSVSQVLNDEIYNEISTIHNDKHCMDYLFSIELLVTEKQKS
jgi:hypothetical protein